MTAPQKLENHRKKIILCQGNREDINKAKVEPEYEPTRPNMTQYMAANIVKGIDANNAPNFPTHMKDILWDNHIWTNLWHPSISWWNFYIPNIEKKIMKPAAIWTTRRLPTRVLPRRPIFSLVQKLKSAMIRRTWFIETKHYMQQKHLHRNWRSSTSSKQSIEQYPNSLCTENTWASYDKHPKSIKKYFCYRTCQPIPRLRTWAGGGVALAKRDAALYAPVDLKRRQ